MDTNSSYETLRLDGRTNVWFLVGKFQRETKNVHMTDETNHPVRWEGMVSIDTMAYLLSSTNSRENSNWVVLCFEKFVLV